MNWEDIIKNDKSEANIKRFEIAMKNMKIMYTKVMLDAESILKNAEKGKTFTAFAWQNNFKKFEEMVEGMKINMNRLTRMSDKEEEEMYSRMREE